MTSPETMPTGKDSEQLTLIMPKSLKERLQKFAKSKRWSMSQAGVVLIEEALDRDEAESKPESGDLPG
jgi:hypothetical protein